MSIVNGTIQKDTVTGDLRGNFGASGIDDIFDNPMTSVGDIIQGSTAGAPVRLASVATGNALISGGVGTANSWGKIGLTTHVSGILAPANGGTGVANTGTITLGGNLTTSGAFPLTLTQTGSTNVTLPTSGTLATTAQLPTQYWSRASTTLSPATANDNIDIGTGTFTGGDLNISKSVATATNSTGILLRNTNAVATGYSPSTTMLGTFTGSVIKGGRIFGSATSDGQLFFQSTNDGTNYSTALTLNSTAGIFSGAIQAVTGGFTGAVTLKSSGGLALSNAQSATSATYGYWINNGGSDLMLWGQDASTGGGLFTGSTAYSGAIGTVGNRSFHLATNNTVRFTINGSGAINATSLAGSGSRVVVADASGNLSAGGAAVTIASPVTLTGTGSIAPTAMISTYLVNPSATTVITITTSGLVAGQIINVKHITTANTTSVQGSSGNVDGAGSVDISVLNTNASLQWDGSNFWNLNK